MLNCTATYRSRDKKPDDNRMDVTSAGFTNISEALDLLGKHPDPSMLSMIENAEDSIRTITKENTNMLKLFTGCDLIDSFSSSLEDAAKLAGDLYGEPSRRSPQ